jgi:Protein of unknown function (DUF2442)
MITTHHIESISFEQNMICLQIDGSLFKIPLEKLSQKLATASESQRNIFTISPSGYGIHWPLLDEDLAVDAILKSF